MPISLLQGVVFDWQPCNHVYMIAFDLWSSKTDVIIVGMNHTFITFFSSLKLFNKDVRKSNLQNV